MARRMREFWDERADENPLFFVDNTLDYRHPDEEAFWAQGRDWLDRLLGEVGAELRPEDDVVEIGCGVGRLTRAIAHRARFVRALDVSPRMLELARRHAGLDNVEWLLGDGESLAGIADASADACISHVVFQHIPDPAVTLGYVREMGRVLRPGGWAAFQVSNDHGLHRKRRGREGMRIFLRAVTRRGPSGQADPHWLGSAVDLDELSRAAADGGLEVARVSGAGTQFCFVLLERPPS
jgi:SAM-dependent methyltransferase